MIILLPLLLWPQTPLCNADRFPPYEICAQQKAFNRAFLTHLECQQAMHPMQWSDYQDAITECNFLNTLWDTCQDAVCRHFGAETRLNALQKLRDLLGEEAFWASRMPPPIPLWACKRIN